MTRAERQDLIRSLNQELVETIDQQYRDEEAFNDAVDSAQQICDKLVAVDSPEYRAKCRAILQCAVMALHYYIESDPCQFEDCLREQIHHVQHCYGCEECVPWLGR